MENKNVIVLKTDKGEAYLNISYDIGKKTVYLDWNWKEEYGYECSKSGLMYAIELLEKHQLNYMVDNMSKVEDNWKTVIDWIVDSWFPQAKRAGLQHLIYIRSDDYFANLPLDTADNSIMLGGLLTHSVKSIEEAQQLLGFPTD